MHQCFSVEKSALCGGVEFVRELCELLLQSGVYFRGKVIYFQGRQIIQNCFWLPSERVIL